MNDGITHKLEVESALGDRSQKTWDDMVEPFFTAKKAELYDTFLSCPVRDKDALVEIHAQHLGLEAMRDHFMTFIETGKLARNQLAKEEDNANN
tara:strand:+ start:515 stop:796 length:282 start_codon:yes stop_codon:yes gene_type:complete